uniref:Uncharacterized protein n=1 Tax=Oryza brachyantha TaxID=4533 RepID=J3NB98_ORYBR
MAELLHDEAEKLNMEFQFHGVVGQLEDLDSGNLQNVLEIKSGEALAVSCNLQLHRLLAADDDATYSSRSAHLNQMASIAQLQHMAAASSRQPSGRLAAVFADALSRKLLNLVPGISSALLSLANSADAHLVPVARRHMFDVLPFLKLAYLTTNHAILEAMEGERFVHVVDFSGPAANPVQWIALFHAFRSRREGPPHLRITAVHDSKEFLATMATVLSKEAEAFDIPFQFNAVEAKLDEMDFDALRHHLGVRSGEALAVSVVLQLHRLLAVDDGRRQAAAGCLTPLQIIARSSPRSFGELLERELNTRLQLSPDASVVSSLSPNSPEVTAPHATPKLGSFLSSLRSPSSKIMVMTEQEANHNGGAFQERFDEALNYYASLFDCLQRSSAPAAERARVERVVLGEEIRGVVACEGAERLRPLVFVIEEVQTYFTFDREFP